MPGTLDPQTAAAADQMHAAARDLIAKALTTVDIHRDRLIELGSLAARFEESGINWYGALTALSAAVIRIAELERGGTDAR